MGGRGRTGSGLGGGLMQYLHWRPKTSPAPQRPFERRIDNHIFKNLHENRLI